MIKVITGYRLKVGADIQPVLMKLRSYAMTLPGFVGAENLVNVPDDTIVAMTSIWENVENWKTWENTKVRKQILKEAEGFIIEQPRITIYKIMPTTGWTYTHLDS